MAPFGLKAISPGRFVLSQIENKAGVVTQVVIEAAGDCQAPPLSVADLRYHDMVQRKIQAMGSDDLAPTVNAINRNIEEINLQIKRQFDNFCQIVDEGSDHSDQIDGHTEDAKVCGLIDPDIALRGLEIVGASGTSTAVLILSNHLTEIQETRSFEHARLLLRTVDSARGYSLANLAGLSDWEASDGKTKPHIEKERTDATAQVAQRFSDALSGVDKKMIVVTSGYSTAVLSCLESVSSKISAVYVIETPEARPGEHQRMVGALLTAKIKEATLIVPEILSRKPFANRVSLAIFGFEAIDIYGDVCHPRSFSDIIDDLSRQRDSKLKIFAVGESWKVQSFSSHDLVPSVVVSYRASGFTNIVTDHDNHEVTADGDVNLKCCMKKWI